MTEIYALSLIPFPVISLVQFVALKSFNGIIQSIIQAIHWKIQLDKHVKLDFLFSNINNN